MRLVILESPYAAPTPEGVDLNVNYARACMADCLARNEAPLASHLLYTQPGVLDDTKLEERNLGINAGLAWAEKADAAVFYLDRGMSNGMRAAWSFHEAAGLTVEERRLGGDWTRSGL